MIGKSTLLDKSGRVICYGYDKHPVKKGWYILITIYDIEDGYTLCLSELEGKTDLDILGVTFPGIVFAPYAQRFIRKEITLSGLKSLMQDSFPDVEFQWESL